MPSITQNHIKTLFAPLKQYGYRGNHLMWLQLQESLQARTFTMTASQLLEWVKEFTEERIAQSLYNDFCNREVNPMNQMVFDSMGFDTTSYIKSVCSMPNLAEEHYRVIKQFVHTLFDHNNVWDSLFEENELMSGEENPLHEMVLFISNLDLGGLSSGGFDVNIWKEQMLPELERRLQWLEQGLALCNRAGNGKVLFVGDVHGRVDKYEALLEETRWDTDEGMLVFVGDLIDNPSEEGVDHISLLLSVKFMVEQGEALCVLGNHEFNAIGWWLKNERGEPCHPHTEINRAQHQTFLNQVGEGSERHQYWIEWFQTLPLFLNFGTFGAVHACWHQPTIDCLLPYLNEDYSLKKEHWFDAFNPDHELFEMIQVLLKGPELCLPAGSSFIDKYGNQRNSVLVAWWNDRQSISTYRDIAIVEQSQRDVIPDTLLPRGADFFNEPCPYPVVIGHYSLPFTPYPSVLGDRVACVDYAGLTYEDPLVGFSVSPTDIDQTGEFRFYDKDFTFVNQPIASSVVNNGIDQIIKQSVAGYPAKVVNGAFGHLVSLTLLKEWDPLGVCDPEEMPIERWDEYAAYEEDVTRIAQSGNSDALAGYLRLVQHHVIGVDVQDQGITCARVAHRLVHAWQNEFSCA